MNGKTIRRIRIALAAVLFLACILVFLCAESGVAGLASMQFGPALLASATGFSLVALTVVGVTLVMTLLFGRVFCAVACPLGTVQDGIRYAISQGTSPIPNLKIVRYCIAFASLALLVGGWAVGFRLFDPFSRFGAMVSSFVSVSRGAVTFAFLGGFLSLIVLALLVFWKRRIFCVSLCPVGTILGVISRFGWYRMRLNTACSGCGRCQRACPTGCIDISAGAIDNERCVLCMDCLALCAVGGIKYSKAGMRRQTVEMLSVDGGRRAFLAKSAGAVVGIAAAGYGMRGLLAASALADEHSGEILPPGAGDPMRFAKRCTSCQLCVASCPTNAIKPTLFGFGAVVLDFNRGRCDYECKRCSDVCPTGALERMTLEEKQWLRIGEAAFEPTHCLITARNEPCALCSQACPVGAIYQPEPDRPPEVNAFHCVGCGACQAVCPTTPKAIFVKAVESQFAM